MKTNSEHCRQYYLKNKEKRLSKMKEYVSKNAQKVREYQKKWRLENKEKVADYQREYEKQYRKDRCKKDPAYRAILTARARVRKFLEKRYKFSKSLGCSFQEFKGHIESQFKSGMSWDNYGQWHIDHKYPLSVAYSEGPDSFAKACNYLNLQPLWAKENLAKSDIVNWESNYAIDQ